MFLSVEGEWINLPVYACLIAPHKQLTLASYSAASLWKSELNSENVVWINTLKRMYFCDEAPIRFCVYTSGCQSKWCLSSLFHSSIYQTFNTAALLQGEKNVSKQLLQQLSERQLSKRQNEITTHSCAGPFSCVSNTVWGLTWWNRYLPSPVLAWMFVIQWSSTEVNGTKQASECLVCLFVVLKARFIIQGMFSDWSSRATSIYMWTTASFWLR